MIAKPFPNISWWKNIRVWLAMPFLEYGVRLVRAHEPEWVWVPLGRGSVWPVMHESIPFRLGHLINRIGLWLIEWPPSVEHETP